MQIWLKRELVDVTANHCQLSKVMVTKGGLMIHKHQPTTLEGSREHQTSQPHCRPCKGCVVNLPDSHFQQDMEQPGQIYQWQILPNWISLQAACVEDRRASVEHLGHCLCQCFQQAGAGLQKQMTDVGESIKLKK